MKKIKFQETLIKYLLALLVISFIASFAQNGVPAQDPAKLMGFMAVSVLLIFIVMFLAGLITRKFNPKK